MQAAPAEQHHTPHLDIEGCCDCLCPACSVEEGPTHVRCCCPDCDAEKCGLHYSIRGRG